MVILFVFEIKSKILNHLLENIRSFTLKHRMFYIKRSDVFHTILKTFQGYPLSFYLYPLRFSKSRSVVQVYTRIIYLYYFAATLYG